MPKALRETRRTRALTANYDLFNDVMTARSSLKSCIHTLRRGQTSDTFQNLASLAETFEESLLSCEERWIDEAQDA